MTVEKKANAVETTAEFYTAAERRIEYYAAGIGIVGTIVALIFWGARPGIGVAVGAAVSWLNYRWMRLGVATMARLSKSGASSKKTAIPPGTYMRSIGRYALLAIGAYVILHFFNLPIVSLLAGFSAALAGVLAEAIGQLFRSGVSAATRS